ncbi:succinate dehydrogenase assembly factor 4, mitochondrial [Pseudonaja textilis]|uniref:Succinate dehydrogenase assembly factor 4, mitochondrial n=2 Tax=Hydrophiinae TaxID=292440 RepID=A0A670YLI7_PSETE|nr:succinate dehydrogenase assembly factor 4, mitochondrial [Notechis scutatus]XP_026550948.1 succinate dehydrogenase assembly factor 4, mitochondrial [Pseudonaja textilis]
MALRLLLRQGRSFVSAGGQASSAFLHSSLGSNTSSAKRTTESTKQPLKKPVTPVGRFDTPEESNVEKEPLEKFSDDINPMTKEKGGPRGPEPTRYGDWERKGRCIDF